MAKYIEHGAHSHPRVFLNPPLKPSGKILTITDEAYEAIKGIHPSNWRIEHGCVKVDKAQARPRWHRDLLFLLLGTALGALSRLL